MTRLLLAAALGAPALLVATCHRDSAPKEPAPVSAPLASEDPVSPRSPPPAPPDAAPLDAAPGAATPDAGKKPAFGAAPSATPGKIACGNAACDLGTQVCCEDDARGVAQCVGKPAKDQYACDKVADAITEKHCDEKADCPGQQTCCMTWGCSGGCPPVAVCSGFPCLHGQVEQCLPGGACSPGFRCVPGEGNRPGHCSYEKAGVACGKKRCSGDEPVCCWNAKKKSGECAKDCGEEPDEDRWALHCTSPDDCGGYPCANAAVSPLQFTACLGSYDVPDRSSVVFCRSIKDCPKMNMLGLPKACLPDASFPGKPKTCRFAGQ